MRTDRIYLNYRKLDVSDIKKTKHQIQLAKLMELAPFGAWIEADLEPKDGKVHGHLVVRNKRHRFEANAVDIELDATFNQLTKIMDRKILNWKRGRFSGNRGSGAQSEVQATA